MATHSSVLTWKIPGTVEPVWAAIYGVAQSLTQVKRLSSISSSSNSSVEGQTSFLVTFLGFMVNTLFSLSFSPSSQSWCSHLGG